MASLRSYVGPTAGIGRAECDDRDTIDDKTTNQTARPDVPRPNPKAPYSPSALTNDHEPGNTRTPNAPLASTPISTPLDDRQSNSRTSVNGRVRSFYSIVDATARMIDSEVLFDLLHDCGQPGV